MEDIQKANQALMEKRAEIKRQRENTMASVKSLLDVDIEQARTKAKELFDTSLWDEVVALFRDRKPEYKCPICGGEGEMSFFKSELKWRSSACMACLEKEEREKIITEVRRKVDAYLKDLDGRLLAHGVARRFINASLGDFPETYHVLMNSEKGLFLTGPRGTGKTHLAVAIMRGVCFDMTQKAVALASDKALVMEYQRGRYYAPSLSLDFDRYTPVFVSVPELLLEIRQAFGANAEYSEKELISKYASLPVLILDDLGAEKSTEWSMQTLFLIIDRRYRDMKKTIITSNLSLEEIAEKVGDRIASRISEMCDVKRIKGEDRRIRRTFDGKAAAANDRE